MYNLFHLFLYCAIVAAVLTIIWKCTFAPYARKREEQIQRFSELVADEFDQQLSEEETTEETNA
jgi:hypothetical protein